MKRKGRRSKSSKVEGESRFKVTIIGYVRGGTPIENFQVKAGDKVYFMLPYGGTSVYRGEVGDKGNIINFMDVMSGMSNAVGIMKKLGFSGKVSVGHNDLVIKNGNTTIREDFVDLPSTKSKTPKSKIKVTGGVAELKKRLAETTNKSEKSKIRAALRSLGHKGGSRQ